MTDEEKRELATMLLERNGYTDEEIEKIIKLAFGEKDEKEQNDS